SEFTPESVLEKRYQMEGHELAAHAEALTTSGSKVEEAVALARSRGIKNVLTVLERAGDAYVTDEVHRAIVEELRTGRTGGGIKEGTPLWSVMHMTLFEVALPEPEDEEEEYDLKTLVSA